MRFALNFAVVALAVGLALGGCSIDDNRYPAPQPCTGSKCGGNTTPPSANPTTGSGGGGQGGAGGTGGTGGAPTSIEQIGTVHLITSTDFQDNGTSYAGAATIFALPNAGGMYSAPYGGSNGTTFDLKNIPSGPAWLLVQDDTGGTSGIISTLSFAKLPVLSGFALPVIDLGVLTTIATGLPTVSAKGVSTLAAQVILFVQKNGVPKKGIAVTGGSAGGQIAYDSGASYSDSAAATSAGGTVILFNAALAGLSTITLTDQATTTTYAVDVQAAPGAATIVTVELP